jgi:hypothetical protein
VSNVSLFFIILASTFKFSLLGIDTDPDRPELDWHALSLYSYSHFAQKD